MQVVGDVTIQLYPNFKSIVSPGEESVYAIRGLDGMLAPATEIMFHEIMNERKYVELIEYPEPDNYDRYYRFLITTAYVV